MLVMKTLEMDHKPARLSWGYIGKNHPIIWIYKYIQNVTFGERPNICICYLFDGSGSSFLDLYSIDLFWSLGYQPAFNDLT